MLSNTEMYESIEHSIIPQGGYENKQKHPPITIQTLDLNRQHSSFVLSRVETRHSSLYRVNGICMVISDLTT